MGIRSKNINKKRISAKAKFSNDDNINCDKKADELTAATVPAAVLPCVAKLHSSDWGLVEEGCADVAAFALQPTQHANLIASGVLQRLVELLFTLHPLKQINEQQKEEVEMGQSIHRGVLYLHLQTAATEALRNLVVNSSGDAVVDALVTTNALVRCTQQQEQEQQNMTFSQGLVTLLLSTWEIFQKTRAEAPFFALRSDANGEKDEEKGEGEDAKNMGLGLHNTTYMAATRLLDEVLQLVAVCAEGNELVAESFSAPHVVNTLLSMLESTTCIVWNTLQHTAQLYSASANSRLTCMRQYKRHEAELLSAVAVAASEVLHVLSSDNEALASFMQSTEAMASHQSFLTSALDATAITTWLHNESPHSFHCDFSSIIDASVPGENTEVESKREEKEDAKLLFVGRQNILYQLCEVSLRIQGTLLNTASNPTNAARVLPLVVAVLDAHPPHMEWRRTVPLLLQECTFLEDYRSLLVNRAICRLRCDQAAVNVLHAVVDAICGLNDVDMDDETAFFQNPHASILYSSQAMYVVGKLMKDALQLLSNGNDGVSGGGDTTPDTLSVDIINDKSKDTMVEQALHAAAGTSGFGGFITKLQLLVLSNEVGVWSLANTLLMMVSWSSLGGEPSQIWSAIISALKARLQLLDGATPTAHDGNGPGVASALIANPSPATLNLLRLQVESLVQMLWTLQRKQTSQAGGSLHVFNILAASPTDVDLITRLAWDPCGSSLQRQACVAVVCSLCISFRSVDATQVATRFALGVLCVDDELKAASASILSSSSPPPPLHLPASFLNRNNTGNGDAACSRIEWLAKIAATDAQWSVRCEAANNIMDLFLDETYDETVYIPLCVDTALRSFLDLFQKYIKGRQQLARDVLKNHRVVLPEIKDMTHWCEVADNLSAFLDYKMRQMGPRRL